MQRSSTMAPAVTVQLLQFIAPRQLYDTGLAVFQKQARSMVTASYLTLTRFVDQSSREREHCLDNKMCGSDGRPPDTILRMQDRSYT